MLVATNTGRSRARVRETVRMLRSRPGQHTALSRAAHWRMSCGRTADNGCDQASAGSRAVGAGNHLVGVQGWWGRIQSILVVALGQTTARVAQQACQRRSPTVVRAVDGLSASDVLLSTMCSLISSTVAGRAAVWCLQGHRHHSGATIRVAVRPQSLHCDDRCGERVLHALAAGQLVLTHAVYRHDVYHIA